MNDLTVFECQVLVLFAGGMPKGHQSAILRDDRYDAAAIALHAKGLLATTPALAGTMTQITAAGREVLEVKT